MICPFCQSDDNSVLETRQNASGQLRRRRLCLGCQRKFSTLEKVCLKKIMVRKRNGGLEIFAVEKIRRGMELALHKRGLSEKIIDDMCGSIVDQVYDRGLPVIESRWIGRQVMRSLREKDEVAYLRFTSVCNDFDNLAHFEQEMKNMRDQTVES